jgi:hypothetical protein
MEGNLLQIGCHRRYGEHVNGCAKEWPDRYNPSGDRDGDDAQSAIAALSSHALALGALEAAIAPSAAAARAAVATQLDREAKFRIVEGDHSCAAFSMALAASYCVEAHNDSGRALEMIAFQYGSETPMPAGHEWLFAVGGLIQQLPTSPAETVFMAVRGEGCAHGTLPTSSSQPHLALHPGFSTTLVTKQDVCRVLAKGEQEGAMWPTHEQLAARRAELSAQHTDPTAAAHAGLAAAQQKFAAAAGEMRDALAAAEGAAADAADADTSDLRGICADWSARMQDAALTTIARAAEAQRELATLAEPFATMGVADGDPLSMLATPQPAADGAGSDEPTGDRARRRQSKLASVVMLDRLIALLQQDGPPLDLVRNSEPEPLRNAVIAAAQRAHGAALPFDAVITANRAAWMDELGVPPEKQARVVGRAMAALANATRDRLALLGDGAGGSCAPFDANFQDGTVRRQVHCWLWTGDALAVRRQAAVEYDGQQLSVVKNCKKCNSLCIKLCGCAPEPTDGVVPIPLP